MAVTKEAIVIALDVGARMCEKKGSEVILESAKTCVNLILQRKIFSESKDEVAFILYGNSQLKMETLESETDLADMFVVQNFKVANWDLLQYVSYIEGSNEMSDHKKPEVLLMATELLKNVSKSRKFFAHRILFISRFDMPFSDEKFSTICDELKSNKIQLNIIGPTGFSEEDIKNGNCLEEISAGDTPGISIKNILKEVNGESYSFSEAFPALIYYQKKKFQSLPWNATLDIGTNLTIPISAYIKVSENKPKSWKNAYGQKLNAKLERGTTYLMNDESQTRVPKDSIVPAFKYGTTLVPYTDDDKQNMEYQSGEKGIKVLGFTKIENIHRHHFIGDKSLYIFGQKNRELAGLILAPLIHALHDTKMVAIGRYVYSNRSAPKIGFLYPKIKQTYECLIFIALPFMEDIRHYVFAPLDADSKNLPTDEQLNAVDDLITTMDLMTASVDDEGNLTEALNPKYTVNPYLQRLSQCLQHRALHPEKPLPDITFHIESIIQPPSKLVKLSEPAVDKIKELFPLKEVTVSKTKEKGAAMFEQPESSAKRIKLSDGNTNLADAISDKIVRVGSVNPVQDFKYLVNNETIPFAEACKQMIDIVYKYISNVPNLKNYHLRIISICKTLRNFSRKKNDVSQYNLFMRNLKVELLLKDVELWEKIVEEKIGLITNKEVKFSVETTSDAEEFFKYTVKSEVKSEVQEESVEDDEEDLMDQL